MCHLKNNPKNKKVKLRDNQIELLLEPESGSESDYFSQLIDKSVKFFFIFSTINIFFIHFIFFLAYIHLYLVLILQLY